MEELKVNELECVDGGVNWDRVYAGAAAVGATTLACALGGPVTLGAAAVAYGCDVLGTAYACYGFATN